MAAREQNPKRRELAFVREARELTGFSLAALVRSEDTNGDLSLAAVDPDGAQVREPDRSSLGALHDALAAGVPRGVEGSSAAELLAAAGLNGNAARALLLPVRPPSGGRRYLLILADSRRERLQPVDTTAAATFAGAAAASLSASPRPVRAAATLRQEALARAARALNESLDLSRVLPRICREAAAILDADSVCVYRGSAAQGLVLEASNGSPDLVGSRLESSSALPARAMAQGRPLLTNAPDPASAESGPPAVSALAVPLRWDGELRGVLWAGYGRERRVDDEVLTLLESFAELAAVACRNANVHAGLAEAARTDALTGCLNHGALQDTLRREMQRARRTGRRLAIVMVDLDDFKQINEEHGHLVGDEVLRRVGRALREGVRPYDFVARYGGDEFAIVAVDAREELAAEIAERAIARVEPALAQVLGETTGPHATAGVAEWREGTEASELVRQADRALLFGKHERGRGVVVRSHSVPAEFELGRPTADEQRGAGPVPAPWPSALRRETEPLRMRTRQLALASELGARIGAMTRVGDIVRATVDELQRSYGWRCAVFRADREGAVSVLASAGGELPAAGNAVERAVHESASVIVGESDVARGRAPQAAAARSEIAVPVWVGDELWGVLDVRESRRDAFKDADARLLETVAEQLGSALRSATEYERLEGAYLSTTEALMGAIETKDARPSGEAREVARVAEAVGRRLGIAGDELRDLRFAAIFRNVGKLAVPQAILGKSGPLSDSERRAVERQAVVGEQILAPVAFLAGVRRVMRSTHERWDGRGYPDGLDGERIPAAARVLQVCEAHSAMTHDRPYRRALTPAAARDELAAGAGTQFDASAVRALLDVLASSNEGPS